MIESLKTVFCTFLHVGERERERERVSFIANAADVKEQRSWAQHVAQTIGRVYIASLLSSGRTVSLMTVGTHPPGNSFFL